MPAAVRVKVAICATAESFQSYDARMTTNSQRGSWADALTAAGSVVGLGMVVMSQMDGHRHAALMWALGTVFYCAFAVCLRSRRT